MKRHTILDHLEALADRTPEDLDLSTPAYEDDEQTLPLVALRAHEPTADWPVDDFMDDQPTTRHRPKVRGSDWFY